MPLFETLREYLTEHCGVEETKVTMEARFTEDMGLDSLDLVELLMEVEERFGLSVSEKEAENLQTVGDVIEFLKGRGVA